MARTVPDLFVVAFAGQTLALPYREIIGVARTVDLQPSVLELPFILGSVQQGLRHWPVFGFTPQFSLLSLPHDQHHAYCACCSADGGETGFAILCDVISPVALEASPLPIPVCIQEPHSPLSRWYWYKNNMLLISNFQDLKSYITHKIQQQA